MEIETTSMGWGAELRYGAKKLVYVFKKGEFRSRLVVNNERIALTHVGNQHYRDQEDIFLC